MGIDTFFNILPFIWTICIILIFYIGNKYIRPHNRLKRKLEEDDEKFLNCSKKPLYKDKYYIDKRDGHVCSAFIIKENSFDDLVHFLQSTVFLDEITCFSGEYIATYDGIKHTFTKEKVITRASSLKTINIHEFYNNFKPIPDGCTDVTICEKENGEQILLYFYNTKEYKSIIIK